jgi:hypothetical protein
MSSESWLLGAPGTFKSFFAIDMAARVGRGEPWLGHDTTQTRVLYILAEDADFASLRFQAWEQVNGPMENVMILPETPQLTDLATWAEIAAVAADAGVGFMIIDTQSRVTQGIDENSAKEMNRYVQLVKAIKEQTGGCVLSVHHTNPDGTRARGSTVQDGAQDSAILLRRPLGTTRLVEMSDAKQKNMAENEESTTITMNVVDLGWQPGWDGSQSSLVVGSPITEATSGRSTFAHSIAAQEAILVAIRECGLSHGLTKGETLRVANEISNVRTSEFLGAWSKMVDSGVICPSETNKTAFIIPGGDDDA